jgi:hypothetical protein
VSGVKNRIAERPFYGFCVIPEWGVLGLDYFYSMFLEDFLEIRRYICITKPNLGNKASLLILSVYFVEKYGLYICIAAVYKGVLNKFYMSKLTCNLTIRLIAHILPPLSLHQVASQSLAHYK